MKFFMKQNNGVIAVISEEHAKKEALVKKGGGNPQRAGVRIFTFIKPELFDDIPNARLFFTGTTEDLYALIEQGGHELVDSSNSPDWSCKVPFSNKEQYGPRHDNDDILCLRRSALEYVCNLHDVIEVFGIKAVTS